MRETVNSHFCAYIGTLFRYFTLSDTMNLSDALLPILKYQSDDCLHRKMFLLLEGFYCYQPHYYVLFIANDLLG